MLPNVEVEGANRVGGRIRLDCRHRQQGWVFTIDTDRVVLATGYTPRRPAVLDPIASLLELDDRGRFRIDARYRVATVPELRGRVYVQNAELHTHGVGAPDLGLGAWRAAVILDDVTGGHAYRLPPPSAFTTFGVSPRSHPVPGAQTSAGGTAPPS
jgi:lysine N6-hydroxylase